MNIKGKRRFEMAKTVAECSTKYTFEQIMKMPKKEFIALWKAYINFYEAEDRMPYYGE